MTFFAEDSRGICKGCEDTVPFGILNRGAGLCPLCIECNCECVRCGHRRGVGFFKRARPQKGLYEDDGIVCKVCDPDLMDHAHISLRDAQM